MPESFGSPWDDYHKWRKWAYEQRYGPGSWDGKKSEDKGMPVGLILYQLDLKKYWDKEKAIGIIERNNRFIGVACLVAKEVVDKESFVRRFGLSFEKDVQWRGVSGLLDHFSRSPLFKAVLITMSALPFKIEPDVPEELRGRLNWARRNYNFHKSIADGLRQHIQAHPSTHAPHHPKQMKEEQDHARKFLQLMKSVETQINEHLKNYFLIKENLFATALFFYVYTDVKEDARECVEEIVRRRYSAKMEISKTYFVRCDDVKDPIIIFNPEFFPLCDEAKKYYCLALANDCAGFTSDKDVAIALKHMFTSTLELPKEEEIEEQIHIPSEEVSIEKPRSAFLGYVVESVIKKKVKKMRVYFPLDVLTGHAIIYGRTRVGKSFASLILIKEALKNGIKVVVFDPHGTLANKLEPNPLLEVNFTRGRVDVSKELQEIYEEASNWSETNELRLLVVLDETRLLKAKNLVYCINELGKRGVGFVLITQYSTSISPEVRNVGTYFIMGAMSETEIERFKEVTLHPSSKLITRLPRAFSFIFSPYWYPEPFFVRHRKID
ncbi:MAG: type IV secretory system conjugative DNA transfer family protein [Candidatus Aenigmarchaeota archaeon]|nr:type IV secretory system conjugative DNA transfer family protein [Candidatus Aenigmarchaeota archaeon]